MSSLLSTMSASSGTSWSPYHQDKAAYSPHCTLGQDCQTADVTLTSPSVKLISGQGKYQHKAGVTRAYSVSSCTIATVTSTAFLLYHRKSPEAVQRVYQQPHGPKSFCFCGRKAPCFLSKSLSCSLHSQDSRRR